ncbi:hypothetical protein OMR07_22740, partial [Methylobacterium organophilum]|nr:hypothetical protein [Methylobacterium organophilum]
MSHLSEVSYRVGRPRASRAPVSLTPAAASAARRARRRGLATAALALFALTAGPAYAQREDQGLQLGCANDYFRLCA